MKATAIAKKWRKFWGYKGKGGVVVVFEGEVAGWMSELRDPEKWRPGCLAVDQDDNIWIARGGNDMAGASSWQANY